MTSLLFKNSCLRLLRIIKSQSIFYCRKEHQLKGRLLGYLLLDIIEDSLITLDAMESASDAQRREKIYQMQSELQQAEERDQFLFQQSAPSSIFDEEADDRSQFDLNIITQNQGVCTSTLLPFQLGNSVQVSFGGKSNTQFNDTSPLLVTPIKNFGHCDRIYAHREGVFIVKEGEGWHELEVPSNMNQGTNNEIPRTNDHGFIFLCFHSCVEDNNNGCNQQHNDIMEGLNVIKIEQGNVEISVDNVEVTSAEDIDGCHILENSHGKSWLNNENPRRHKIQFRVNEPNARLEITSIILL